MSIISLHKANKYICFGLVVTVFGNQGQEEYTIHHRHIKTTPRMMAYVRKAKFKRSGQCSKHDL